MLSPEFYKKAIEEVRALSHEEAIALLKQAGILDDNGRLSERYRPPDETTATESTAE